MGTVGCCRSGKEKSFWGRGKRVSDNGGREREQTVAMIDEFRDRHVELEIGGVE